MGMIHLEKRGIRALGIAESFKRGYNRSIIAGVVMRSDLIIDGVALNHVTIKGDDATSSIMELYDRLGRSDINLLMLDGLIISMYNIIDIDALYNHISKPIIAITFEESEGLDEHIKRTFDEYDKKLEAYHKLGGREMVITKTGYNLYIRSRGIDLDDTRLVIDKFLLQGSIPEPIRVAKLIARAYIKVNIHTLR